MDYKLQQDLDRFFRVYRNNVCDMLHQKLPSAAAMVIERELDEEFALFQTSVVNRLEEEFNRR